MDRLTPRERWFWIGVGFACAFFVLFGLTILLLGLFFSRFLPARAALRSVVGEASAPAPLPPELFRLAPPAPPRVAPDLPAPPSRPPSAGIRSQRSHHLKARTTGRPRIPSLPARAAVLRAKSRPRPRPRTRGPLALAAATPGSGGALHLIQAREAYYPTSAMLEGVTGKVRVRMSVDPTGVVRRAVVARSSGDKRLDAAALRAAMAWRYRPAQRDGRSVPSTDQAEFAFFHARQ